MTLTCLLVNALTLRILRHRHAFPNKRRSLTGIMRCASTVLNRSSRPVLRPSQGCPLNRSSFPCFCLSLRHIYEQEIHNFRFCWQKSLIVNSLGSDIVSAFALSCHQGLFRMKEGMLLASCVTPHSLKLETSFLPQ